MNEYVREYAKIESRARRRGSFLLTYVPWIVVLAAASIFGRVWTQTRAVSLVDEVGQLKHEERELLLNQEEHRRAIVRLTGRERVAQVAREGLNMDYPDEDDVVFLPVAASPERPEPPRPQRVARPENGFVAFFRNRLRSVVNQEAYALSTM